MSEPSYIVYNESIGYVAVLHTGDNEIWKKVPPEGILLRDDRNATVFSTRQAAMAAIQRTCDYLSARNPDRAPAEWSLRRLKP